MPQYQGVWTLEAQAQALTNQQWVTDPNFKNTTLLLQADGTGSGSQNQTFLDSSTNNFFITRNGNTTQGSFSPFSQAPGYWSDYMTSGYLTTAANAGFALSGDFTVECWVYSGDSSLDSSTRRRIFHTGGGDIASSLQLLLGTSAGNSAVVSVLNNGWLIDGTINVVTNSWNHVAVTRSGTSLKLFVNGAQSGTTATTSQSFNSGTSNTVYIGANSSGNGIWQGYISNLRVIVGTAIYTAPFTPPTTPFATGTTNQQLLVCYNNNFNDANTATTAKTITVNSTPSVQAFGPFAPALQWTPDVVGGSAYFDASGDYLSFATGTSAFQLGAGDWSVEGWVYLISSSVSYIASGQTDATTIGGSSFYVGYNGDTCSAFSGGGRIDLSLGTVNKYEWTHIAFCRSGSTVSCFKNGVRQATGTFSGTINTGATNYPPKINATGPSTGTEQYLSGVRIVKGSSPYNAASSTITVPTAPVTAITNTALLVSMTNAGIYDGKMANNLETVGNAQVSTNPVKYGSGSIKFNGSTDYLKPYYPAPANGTTFSFGTGDFTIEFWMYPTSLPSAGMLMDGRGSGASGDMWLINFVSGVANWYVGGNLITSSTISANTWTHLAVCKANGSTRMFLNGIQTGSTYADTRNYTVGNGWPTIGASYNAVDFFAGYMDDIRITKSARYIANFTPPQQALPRQ